MGHWTGIKYTIKLNEADASFEDILVNMQEEIDKKHKEEEKDPGESFGAGMSLSKGILTYSSSGYKSRVSNDISYELLKKIEKNINTQANNAYYFIEDNGENKGAIEKLFGYAQTVGQYLLDAGYANNYGNISFYNEKGIEKFHSCLADKKELAEVYKEGEQERFKRELKDKTYKVNLSDVMDLLNYDSEKKLHTLDQQWLAYLLVYGTDEKLSCKITPVSTEDIKVKEFLYAVDHDIVDRKTGANVLKRLLQAGVEFKEGNDSIEGNFKVGTRYDYSGRLATKELIENWYQENKVDFKEMPKISKETANYIKEKYPVTFEKLRNKLIELHNHPKNLTEETVKEEKANPFTAYRKKNLK